MLPLSFYQRDDVVEIARDLIGRRLMSRAGGLLTGGVIVETEAYCGATDKACHAHFDRRTKRTSIMYEPGGRAYVYLCYGIQSLFNIVTKIRDKADAVLVRAIAPDTGLEIMRSRRNVKRDRDLTSGPGKLTVALGIDQTHYGEELTGTQVWLEKGGKLNAGDIITTTRIGVDYAGEDSQLPWRFYLKNNPFVSRK